MSLVIIPEYQTKPNQSMPCVLINKSWLHESFFTILLFGVGMFMKRIVRSIECAVLKIMWPFTGIESMFASFLFTCFWDMFIKICMLFHSEDWVTPTYFSMFLPSPGVEVLEAMAWFSLNLNMQLFKTGGPSLFLPLFFSVLLAGGPPAFSLQRPTAITHCC